MHFIFDFEADWAYLVRGVSWKRRTRSFSVSSGVRRSKGRLRWPPCAPIAQVRGLLTMHCLGLASSSPSLLCGWGTTFNPQCSLSDDERSLEIFKQREVMGAVASQGPLAKAPACVGRTDELDWWGVLWPWSLADAPAGVCARQPAACGNRQLVATGRLWQPAACGRRYLGGVVHRGWLVLTPSARSLGTPIVFATGRFPYCLERFIF